MMRYAADLDTSNGGASRRIVKSVRQYAATRIRALAPQQPHQEHLIRDELSQDSY
jgi:hypothetical protein